MNRRKAGKTIVCCDLLMATDKKFIRVPKTHTMSEILKKINKTCWFRAFELCMAVQEMSVGKILLQIQNPYIKKWL
jgi:hypothetical protein